MSTIKKYVIHAEGDTLPSDVLVPEFTGNAFDANNLSDDPWSTKARKTSWIKGFPILQRSPDK